MKTTVEIPDDLMERVRRYATGHGKTFKEVVVDSLGRTVGDDDESEPGWMKLFGTSGVPVEEIRRIQAYIDEEFDQVDPADWE